MVPRAFRALAITLDIVDDGDHLLDRRTYVVSAAGRQPSPRSLHTRSGPTATFMLCGRRRPARTTTTTPGLNHLGA